MDRKSVLITGCSVGGIGDALAKEFHRNGLRVFATARNPTKIEHLEKLGLETLPLDVVDETSIKAAVKTVQGLTGGTLDILVNNSGSGYVSPLLDTDLSQVKALFDVNVFAVIEVTKAFAPLLIASKGTIVNIGSIAGTQPIPWQGYYNASKAAVHLLTSQLRLELSPFGVEAICVVTGSVTTNFFDNASPTALPPDSLYTPAAEEIRIVETGEAVKDGSQNVDEYARAVVKNTLKRSPNPIPWIGGTVNIMWLVNTFFWATGFEFIMRHFPTQFKFPQATAKIQAKLKSE